MIKAMASILSYNACLGKNDSLHFKNFFFVYEGEKTLAPSGQGTGTIKFLLTKRECIILRYNLSYTPPSFKTYPNSYIGQNTFKYLLIEMVKFISIFFLSLPSIKNILLTFTLLSIRMQFKSNIARTLISSKRVYTGVTASMLNGSTFIELFHESC